MQKRAVSGLFRSLSFILALAGSSLPQGASAFESAEHIWLSNRAVCLVLAERKVDPVLPIETCLQVRERDQSNDVNELLRCLAYDPKKVPNGYGDIVAYPDFVPRADFLINQSPSPWGPISQDEISKRRDEVYWGFAEILRNQHHFREAALRGYVKGHADAVRAAAFDPGNLRILAEALALNAYADHFLEDFFAPGHMIEEAGGRSHMANARAHDLGNARGRDFVIDPGLWHLLVERVMGFDLLKENDEAARKRAEANLDSCFANTGVFFNTLLRIDESVRAKKPIHFVGDGDVIHEHGAVMGAEEQALLISLVVASSIQDVLAAYESEPVCENECSPNTERPDSSGTARPVLSCCSDLSDPACFSVVPNRLGGRDTIASIPIGSFVEPEREESVFEKLAWPVVGMAAELQTSNGNSRVVASPELIWPLPFVSDSTALQLGIGYSYIGRTNGSYNGHGPDLRLHLHWKEISMMAEADVGYRFYDGFGESSSNPRAGVRLGFGNGLLFGFVSYSVDKRLTRNDGSKWDYSTFGLGVTVNFSSAFLARSFRQNLR